jgi:phage gp16-like protein
MSHAHPEKRRRHLAAIHAAKKTLDLDNETYRDLLERVSATKGSPVRSAAQLSEAQLHAVLDEFKRLGGLKPSPKTKGKPHNFNSPSMPEMITKIEALLTDMQLPWSYADAIAMQQFRIAKVAWCRKQDQLRSLIAALHVEQEKRQLLAAVDELCVRAGTTRVEIEARYGLDGRAGWMRNRTTLKRVIDAIMADYPQAIGAAQ